MHLGGGGWGGKGCGLREGSSRCNGGDPPLGSWGQTHIWGHLKRALWNSSPELGNQKIPQLVEFCSWKETSWDCTVHCTLYTPYAPSDKNSGFAVLLQTRLQHRRHQGARRSSRLILLFGARQAESPSNRSATSSLPQELTSIMHADVIGYAAKSCNPLGLAQLQKLQSALAEELPKCSFSGQSR